MSEVLENLKTRRSVRKYTSQMPSREDICTVMEAGIYAASGKNMQSPIVIAVTNKDLRDKIAKTNCKIGGWKEDFDPFYNAPVILICLANKESANYIYDGSLTLGNMMTAAHDLGLGTCWIHRARQEFEMDEFKGLLKALGIEGEYEGIGHLALGYVDGEYPKAQPRKEKRTYFIE